MCHAATPRCQQLSWFATPCCTVIIRVTAPEFLSELPLRNTCALDDEEHDMDAVCEQEAEFENEVAGAEPSWHQVNPAVDVDVLLLSPKIRRVTIHPSHRTLLVLRGPSWQLGWY